jgi:hypothetical protein
VEKVCLVKPPPLSALMKAQILQGQAYAWGRKDEGATLTGRAYNEYIGEPSLAFGFAWARRVWWVAHGHLGFLPALRDAFELWQSGEVF